MRWLGKGGLGAETRASATEKPRGFKIQRRRCRETTTVPRGVVSLRRPWPESDRERGKNPDVRPAAGEAGSGGCPAVRLHLLLRHLGHEIRSRSRSGDLRSAVTAGSGDPRTELGSGNRAELGWETARTGSGDPPTGLGDPPNWVEVAMSERQGTSRRF